MKSSLSFLAGSILTSIILSACSHRDEIIHLSGEATDAERRGQHELAIGKWNAVLKLVTSSNKNYAKMQERLALYEERQPFRQKLNE